MASSAIVTAKNTTGKTASDLHLTFFGSGGSLFVDPTSVGVTPGGAAPPQVPSNPPAIANEVDIEWSTPSVPPGGVVSFDITTPFGPLVFVSGYWTAQSLSGVAIIGPVNRDDVTVFPKQSSSTFPLSSTPTSEVNVINTSGDVTPFLPERVIGTLVKGGLDAPAAIASAGTLDTVVRATGLETVTTSGIRQGLGEILANPTSPDVQRIAEGLRATAPQAAAPPLAGDIAIDGPLPLLMFVAPPDYTLTASEALIGLLGREGRFLDGVERSFGQLISGQKLSTDEMTKLYDEGVSLQSLAATYCTQTKQQLLDWQTGETVEPQPIRVFNDLLKAEDVIGFRLKVLVSLFAAGQGAAAIDWDQVLDELILKILGILGIEEFSDAILDALHGDTTGALKDAKDALTKKAFWTAVERLLKLIFSKAFLEAVKKALIKKGATAKAAEEAAKKIGKAIASKWIPIFGWAGLIGRILAVLISQIIYGLSAP